MSKLTQSEIQEINRKIAAGRYVHQPDHVTEQKQGESGPVKKTRARRYKPESTDDE